MTIRSFRERVIQTGAYEAGGLLLAVPLYASVSGDSASASLWLLLALWLAELLWSSIHNLFFDPADLSLSGRVASDRPRLWRMVHAVSAEASSAVVTVPILMTLGGHSLGEALVLDAALALLFTLYTFAFHLGFDRLRPVAPSRAAGWGAALASC
jgi:uncharacterized membrane protein